MRTQTSLFGLFAHLLRPLTDALRDERAVYSRPAPQPVAPAPAPTPEPSPEPEPAVELLPWPAYRPTGGRAVVWAVRTARRTSKPRPASRRKSRPAPRPSRVKPPAPSRFAPALTERVVRCPDCGEPVILVADPDDPSAAEEVCPACPLPIELAPAG